VRGVPYALRLMGSGVRRPAKIVPGTDIAGVVESVGASVTGLAPGHEVFGESARGFQWSNGGAYAEFVDVPAAQLARKPAAVPFEQAACVPTAGIIALLNLRALPRDATGWSVLVNGAAGGVGSIALQVAKARGATVTGVAREAKLEFVRSLGADRAVAYDRPGSDPFAGAYDAIIDTGGDTPLGRLRGALNRRGTLVIVGGEGGGSITGMGRQLRAMLLSPFVRQRLMFIVNRERRDELERLRALVEDGAMAPRLDTAVPLVQAADAVRRMTAGGVCGKLAVAPPPVQL
jgi:NADPH:quinone reductase-like Zn-dependent oxidoreductase